MRFRTRVGGEKPRFSATEINAWNRTARTVAGQVNATQQPQQHRLLAELTEDIDKGAFGDADILIGPKGSESKSGELKRVYNRWLDLSLGTVVLIEFVVNGWEVVQGECEPSGGPEV